MAGYVVATGAPSLSSPRGRPLCLGWWPLATGRRPGHRRDVRSTAFSGPPLPLRASSPAPAPVRQPAMCMLPILESLAEEHTARRAATRRATKKERRGRAGVHGRGCSHGAAAARQTWLLPFLGHHEMCELRVCREAIRAGGGICNRGGERVREQRQRRSREGTFGGRRGLMWDLPP